MIRFHLIRALAGSAGPFRLDISTEIGPGELLALTGPSGAGKTSVLRMLAGLMRPDGGYIEVEGHCWYRAQPRCWRSPQARSVGYVFQDYGLFPHMSIWQNLCFALPRGQAHSRVGELLELVGLSELRDRRPGDLSGGQQQRVALVRAFIRQPRLLLLDEPLAAQDRQLRAQLQADLQQLHAHLRVPGILVSHDPGEILRLAQRVIRLEPGGAVQSGPPAAVLAPHHPVQVEVLAYAQGQALVLAGGQPLWVPVNEPVAPGSWISLRGSI